MVSPGCSLAMVAEGCGMKANKIARKAFGGVCPRPFYLFIFWLFWKIARNTKLMNDLAHFLAMVDGYQCIKASGMGS